MNNGAILIDILFPSFDWNDAKIHVAQKSPNNRPIDVFTRSFDEWQNDWNGNFHSNHCWNKQYIFSMIELPTQPDCWLFAGIFKVLSYQEGKSLTGKEGVIYKVSLSEKGQSMIGRLVIHWVKDARIKGRKPERMLANMRVSEILPETYAGEDFPGYTNVNHRYDVLEKLWLDSKSDWLAALTHCQGVYLITDLKTGLRYVGSAYGEEGIWSRWGDYFTSGGHAGNALLKKLLSGKKSGIDYARKNFQISLLEQASSRDSEQYIIQRESYWKRVLLTRGKYGLNQN
ncbi:MAG: GIY-YIG nuclease family protein [Gammaproteobacteria bacterium]|nr:GIY-YIG nuclease family protein [Gammaproteobacteria bacterium]MBQ0840059.1 GIY-YIG nuclease family protein [Gammaproteobacteria bacterium]